MTISDTPSSPTAPSLFGREPALLLGVVSGVIAVASNSIFHLDATQQGATNAVAAGVLGLIVAFRVRGGTWAAALMALVQAILAELLAWKFHLDPELQSGIVFLTSAIGAYATRAVVHADPPALPGSSALA